MGTCFFFPSLSNQSSFSFLILFDFFFPFLFNTTRHHTTSHHTTHKVQYRFVFFFFFCGRHSGIREELVSPFVLSIQLSADVPLPKSLKKTTTLDSVWRIVKEELMIWNFTFFSFFASLFE